MISEKYFNSLLASAKKKNTAEIFATCNNIYWIEEDCWEVFDYIYQTAEADARCNRLDGAVADFLIEAVHKFVNAHIG